MTCPNKNLDSWKALESTLGEDQAYRAWIRNNGEYPTPMEAAYQLFIDHNNELGGILLTKHVNQKEIQEVNSVLDTLTLADPSLYQEGEFTSWAKTQSFAENLGFITPKSVSNTLFGLGNTQQELEFHINTLNAVNQFLDKVGVEQRLIPEFLQQDGSIVEGALAAANFIKGTVDIIDDLHKRPAAWNKLPEEAAHWWYRLLDTNSPLKKALWESHQIEQKAIKLKGGYESAYKGDFNSLKEEGIGQLVAEAIKRIEDKNGSPADYSFLQKFVDWINSVIKTFQDLFKEQDPFEVAAIKILANDISDLMSFEEYNKLHNQVYFAEQLSNQTIKPIDYTLIDDLVQIDNMGNLRMLDIDEERGIIPSDVVSFNTDEERDLWVYKNYGKELDKRQKNREQEVRDNQVFFDRLLNKSFKKRSKYLPKTLKKYYTIGDSNNLNKLSEWNINDNLVKITKKLGEEEKKLLVQTNNYTNVTPTLKVLPDLLKKYKKNPIVLNESIKIDGAKKQELNILNGIKDLIKHENPGKKTITAEEFVNEAHTWLETNYMLGFANESAYGGYRIDQTFNNVPDRVSNEDFNMQNIEQALATGELAVEEQMRLRTQLGLTKQNPQVYHNKVSLRFNDNYHLKSSHFNYAPSAWGNLTYFYTGASQLKDAVLLHEIQNDNIEHLREAKIDKLDLDQSFGKYLQDLNSRLLDNISQIETGGKKVSIYNTELELTRKLGTVSHSLLQTLDYPLDQAYNDLKQRAQENADLYTHGGVHNSMEYWQERIEKSYTLKRQWQNFLRNGGLKSILTEKEISDLGDTLIQLNNSEEMFTTDPTFLTEENQFEPGHVVQGRDLKQKKNDFIKYTRKLSDKINSKIKEVYGDDAPEILLKAPAKPLPKAQRQNRVTRRGRYTMITGNASQDLSENVNWLLTYNEKQVLDGISKGVAENKQGYTFARNATVSFNFNKKLSKITKDQYEILRDNFKYNQDLLKKLVDLEAKKELASQTTISGNEEVQLSKILNEQETFNFLKEKALVKKEQLAKEYGKIEEELKQTLEIELNYFTPLIHHLLQKHISQFGKDFPMYFAGYNITKLTQGNDRTALIYAGKDEVEYTKEQADEIKKKAAIRLNLAKDSDTVSEAIIKLNEFKKQSKQNLDRVVYELMNQTNNKPLETGALYNAMSQISGVKLIWDNSVSGLKGEPGGYRVDLSNYNYTTPILYGLENKVEVKPSVIQDINQTFPNTPVTNDLMTEETQGKLYGEEVASKVLDQLSDQLNIPYEKVTPDQARTILEKTQTPYNSQASFFFNGTNYQVIGKFTPVTAVHEFAHPFLKAIAKDNSVLFQKLFAQVGTTPEMEDLVNKVSAAYPHLDPLSDRFKEEVIVHAIEKDATNKVLGKTSSKGFTDFITNLWYSVKQLLRKLFGKKINISKLNTNTTLSELATMLAGDKMNLQTYNITEQDFADFRNDLDKFYKDLEKYKEGNKAQQTVNLMYEMMNKQMNMINKNPKAFEDIKKFLVDEEGKGLVKDIRNTLQSFQTLNQSDVEAAKKFRAQVNFKKQEANAIIDSLDSLGFIANKVYENLKDIDTEGSDPSRETLMKVVHYGYLTDYWNKFIAETIKEMDDAGISSTSELAKLLSNAKASIDQATRKANSIKKKFAGSFVEAQVQAMKEVIDNDYTAALAKLKAKNAPQNEIDKLTKEYNRLKLDRAKIDDILSGKGVDMNWANAMFESYSMAHDPIIGGVAMFIKNTLADIDIAVQQKSNDLMRTLEPLLVANNYSPTDTQKLGKEVTFEDTVAAREKDEDGNEYVVQTKVYTYLNPFKNYRYDKGVLWDNLQKAIIKGDEQEIAEAQRLYNQLEKDYFNRDKTAEFYAIEDKYKNSDKTYTDSDGKQVNIAHEAFAERSSILNEIQQVNPHTALEIDVYKNYDVTKQLWRDYSQLYSLTDIDGKPKTGIELQKAQLLRDYRTATRDMYEWKERPRAFEEALSNFESQLEASGVTPEEFKTQVDEWIIKNTKRTYDQSWYQERTKAIETLQRIFAKLDRDERTSLDITESWGKILDTVAGFRDEEGQPVASDMSVTRIDTVRKNQQLIEDAKYKLAGLSGMSPEEMDRINTYFSKRKAKIDLTIEEEDDFEELLSKKEEGKLNGLDEFDKAQLLAAFASLAELQEKLPTDYYLDRINYWTRELNQPAIDEKNAGDILSGEALAPLFKKSPEFEEWFKKNHIKRMIFNKATKTKKEQWERLYVWSVVQPKDEKYIKKTTLKRIDPLTGKPMVIIGVPGIKYQYKQLNAKYRTKKVLGETVDINGQWLPKTLAQGAKDDKYINKEYYDLEKTNPSRFKLINTLRDAHLNIQKGLPYASRLGNDIPRYRKQNLEYVQTATPQSILTAWGDSIKAAKDDFEAGLNYEQNNQLSLVRADLFSEEIDTIPITGTSKIDLNQTSLDVLYGMHKYMYSAERQKKLLEINPMVKAIRDTLNNKENGPKDIYKANKSKQLLTGVTEFLGKKGPYIRASALNALYEREFLGKTVTGFSENSPGLNKIVSFLMGKASFSFFAFNIPSGIKNMFGGMFQNMIETAGGEYVNAISMAKGTASATKAVVKLQNDIYTRGPKSLEYQMTEIFDFVQGRFEESIGRSSSRTFASDAASLSWFMSARKLMEIESTLQLSYGIMHNIFVEQTLPDGSKKKLEYADAWELKNGQISLKEGIDKTYDKGGEFFLRTRNLIHAKNEQMQGSFSKFSQPDAQRYLAFRLLSYMRRYFTSMFINRFGKNRYNWGETTVREGYYLTGMRATLEIIKSMGQHLKYLSPRERVAYVKFLTEISALIVLSATMGLLFGYDPDDPDRFAKLRAKSGALGSDDFELQGWLSNHTLNMVMQVRNENETFIPWPGFGLDDYLQLKDVTSIAFGATLNTYGEIVVDILNTIKQDPSAYYKQDIGIYPWQKKGSNKTLQDIAKMFGITSGSMDPVGTIRRFEGAKSKYK